MQLQNVNHLGEEFVLRSAGELRTLLLGAAGGGRRLYVNVDRVPPGRWSTKYHSHSRQEEFFLLLRGSGTLRLGGETVPVVAGDFFAKPAGMGLAHAFYNSGTEELEILDVGTVEDSDVCDYPDEGVRLVKADGSRRWFRGGEELADWSSDPNGP